jgi:HAD superfamily hydrolase (TIGR01509 family)
MCGVISHHGPTMHEIFYNFVKENISMEEFNARYLKARTGEMSFYEFMQGLPKEAPEQYVKEIKFHKGAKEALEQLKGKTPMFLVSNHLDKFGRLEIENLGIENYFQKIFLSNEIKMVKPTKEFFDKIIQDTGIKPQEAIFVEDTKPYLEKAKELGFTTIWVNNETKDPRNETEYRPDYEIKSIDEIIPIIEALNKQ